MLSDPLIYLILCVYVQSKCNYTYKFSNHLLNLLYCACLSTCLYILSPGLNCCGVRLRSFIVRPDHIIAFLTANCTLRKVRPSQPSPHDSSLLSVRPQCDFSEGALSLTLMVLSKIYFPAKRSVLLALNRVHVFIGVPSKQYCPQRTFFSKCCT